MIKNNDNNMFVALTDDQYANAKVIAVANNKGGCGKTTLAHTLACYFANKNKKILLVDMDAQCNLTEIKLQISSEAHQDIRIDKFFKNMLNHEKFTNTEKKFPITLNKCFGESGSISIIAGSKSITPAIISVDGEFKTADRYSSFTGDVYTLFRERLRWYLNYYDYIIIDTAPTITNIANNIAMRAVDEIIIPIDGIEAIAGAETFLNWVKKEIIRDNIPNVLFVMDKYQNDTKNIREQNICSSVECDSDIAVNNTVYRIIKQIFGDLVCDRGIKELQSIKNTTYDGCKDTKKYDLCCAEIESKFYSPRQNIAEFWSNGIDRRLEAELHPYKKAQHNNQKPNFRIAKYKNMGTLPPR
jgi:cellulose biosynthesis protein BcsQ